MAKQRTSFEAAIDSVAEMQAEQRKAQWKVWTTCVHCKRAKKECLCQFGDILSHNWPLAICWCRCGDSLTCIMV